LDTPVGKRKNEQAPVDVKEVKRSRRIAIISAGYEDKEAADAAMARELEKEQQKEARKGKDKGKDKEKKTTSAKVAKKNLNSEFEVEIIDRTGPLLLSYLSRLSKALQWTSVRSLVVR
jgi:hypothetical protein